MSTVTNNIWFEGPVSEAVALVNSKDCVFVVYIFDDTENTQKLNETLDNEDVIHALSSKAVALKMHTESDNAKMFKQLYPTYHVPVIYFIRHGTIKDFGVEDVTADAIVSKINATSTSEQQQPQQQTSPATPAAPAPAPMSPAPSSTETSAVTDQPQPSQGSSSVEEEEATNAAKKEKLRKQMEEAKKKREEEEKQRAKDNELKRRQDGKLMQQTRQQLENKQNKQYFDKIKKEKREDEEHRRRIKEQIARDRAEQMAARQAAKQQRKSANSSPEASTTSVKRARNSSSSSQHDHSSISIRQLDGSTMRNRFNASDTLSVVKNWIDQNRSDGDQPYKLLAQFPTRQFSIGDEERSLRELDLCPSATLIMKGIKNVSNAYGAGSSYGVMDYVYSAGGLLYNAASSVGTTVSGVMYSMFPSDQGAPPSEANVQSPGGFPNTGVTQQTPSSSIPGQRLGGVPSSTRPRSNINTLRNTAFDDDDNEHRTYNGNSVNQE